MFLFSHLTYFVQLLYFGKLSRPKYQQKLNKIMKISQEDWFWLKISICQSSMVREGCWANCLTRVGNFEASTVCEEISQTIQDSAIESYTQAFEWYQFQWPWVIPLTHTSIENGSFIRNLTNWSVPFRLSSWLSTRSSTATRQTRSAASVRDNCTRLVASLQQTVDASKFPAHRAIRSTAFVHHTALTDRDF